MNIEKPLIYLISDGTINPKNYSSKSEKLLELIENAVVAGISMIQIREKKLETKLLFQLTSKAVKLKQNSNTKILVNDRADVALAAEADGVHLASNSIPINVIKQNLPSDFLIGVSTHSIKEVFQARDGGADFAVFGPVFSTPNKGEPKGLEGLSEVVNMVNEFPVLALGGIDERNIHAVLQTGCGGLAAIRLLNDVEKLPKIVKIIRGEMDE